MKFVLWQEQWLEIYQKPLIKYHTYRMYKDLLKQHILNYFKEDEIENINTQKIQLFLHEKSLNGNLITHKPLSASTINLLRSILNNIFQTACNFNLLDINPCSRIKRFTYREKEIQVFSKKQQKILEDYCKNNQDIRLFGIVFALYTGLRIGELLALKWEDIDLKKKIIYVKKTVLKIKTEEGKWVSYIDSAKTKSSIRVIPIAKNLYTLLLQHRKKNFGKWLICDKNNQAVNNRTYQKLFQTVLIKLQMPLLSFHSLRHTFATRAIENGIDVKTVSELMGHQNTSITLNRYTHSLFETKKKAVNLLAKNL